MICRLALALCALLTAGPVLAAVPPERSLHLVSTQVKTLDPALADDLPSRNLCGALFDTLLQYDYTARPYRLVPSMLTALPTASDNYTRYDFELRDDLEFAPSPLAGNTPRRITAHDVRYSLLRLADSRLHSPLYWMIRGKIDGVDAFHRASADAPRGDDRIYDLPVAGIRIADDRHFSLHLTAPDPRFLYVLAMPNMAIVPREAARHPDFARRPVGSGPFVLSEFITDYRMTLKRNPRYRRELFPQAETPADRVRPLPLTDRVEVLLVKQPLSAWLLFLQGKLDLNELSKDNADMVSGGELPEVLVRRGIRLLRQPEFEVRYVGFNFNDPRLGRNLELRRALSLAYDVNRRVEHAGGQLIPTQGPLPPHIAGWDPDFRNPYAGCDVAAARRHLAAAGFPGGVDPATGEALHLTFDQAGNHTAARQLGEITSGEFARIGLQVDSCLNNRARFFDKLRQGQCQLFRLSWVGDYPDAENFLQLFYSGNLGSCNRTGYSDPVFDAMFEAARPLADSPERTKLYQKMVAYLAEQCVWIYEGVPISYLLCHQWLENYHPHDFAFARWKYLSVDPARRDAVRQKFTPLSLRELNAHEPGGNPPGKNQGNL